MTNDGQFQRVVPVKIIGKCEVEDYATLRAQRDHARRMVGTLLGLLNQFPTDISDYDLPHQPAPGDGWDPLKDDDE